MQVMQLVLDPICAFIMCIARLGRYIARRHRCETCLNAICFGGFNRCMAHPANIEWYPWPGSLGVWCQVVIPGMLLPVVTTHMTALAMPHHGDGTPYQSLIGSRNLRLEGFEQVRLVGWQLAAWSGHGKTCLLCLFAARLNSDDTVGIFTLQ